MIDPEDDEARSASSGEDLATTLHEVGNALTVVLGWIDTALAGGEAEALEVARLHAQRAFRLARGAIAGQEAPRALAPLLDEMAEALEPKARAGRVEIVMRVELSLRDRLVEHPARLTQVLENLLLNALAVSPRGESIAIDAKGERARVVFAIEDGGPGIEPERRSAIFEGGASARPGGAGIGLRYAASLAKSVGGDLRLAPSQRGARFEVEWPLGGVAARGAVAPKRSEARSATNGASSNGLSGLRVLLVEDDEDVIDLLELTLEARGAIVRAVRAEAELEEAMRDPFDVALLDLSPLGARPDAWVESVRRARPEVRLVVISGRTDAPELSGVVWLQKPFQLVDVLAAIAREH